ncbi:MAG TPA: SDR family oxidoreductase [Chitinophagaceae bacterium]|jgi:NAD(P)-dependent dehydrogenase (short-subunit alcohol dehydrogenase family)|nr:SDR family oxidoreductase [Chitinophagaceae bacterium]
MQRFHNKTILITGGTSGIGLATAEAFLQEGAQVLFTGRYADTVHETAHRLGSGATGIVSDASRKEAAAHLAEKVRSLTPQLDVLFLNAGYGKFAPLEAVSEDLMEELFQLHVKGPLFTLQALLPLMPAGSAVILNTSVVTRYGMAGSSVYAAAKSAAASLVQNAAAELAGRGIRINAVSPGYTETSIFRKTGMTDEQIEGAIASVLPTLPFGRFARPEEIARAVCFLASGDASYVHGTELVVDGGYSAIRK